MQVEDARQRILSSAKAIFLEMGYKRTTIRQIVRHSGLMIGSIYHFFQNKEDIFQQLFSDIFDRCDELIRRRYGEDADPPLRLALMCATMLQAADLDENICELYGELLSLHGTAEQHTQHFADWLRTNLHESLAGQSDSEIFARALAITGVLRGMLANFCYRKRLPLSDSIRVMSESAFAILSIPPERAATVTIHLPGLQNDIISIARELIAP